MDQLNAANPRSWQLSPVKAVMFPSALVVGLGILAFVQPQGAILTRAYFGAAGALLAGTAALYVALRRSGRTVTMEIVLRDTHYVQVCVQAVLLALFENRVPKSTSYLAPRPLPITIYLLWNATRAPGLSVEES